MYKKTSDERRYVTWLKAVNQQAVELGLAARLRPHTVHALSISCLTANLRLALRKAS